GLNARPLPARNRASGSEAAGRRSGHGNHRGLPSLRSRNPMKFVTFDANGQERLGVVDAKRGILDLQKASSALPGSMIAFIEAGQSALDEAKKVVSSAADQPG